MFHYVEVKVATADSRSYAGKSAGDSGFLRKDIPRKKNESLGG